MIDRFPLTPWPCHIPTDQELENAQSEKAEETAKYLSLDKEKDIYILYELYDEKIAEDVRNKVIDRIKGGAE